VPKTTARPTPTAPIDTNDRFMSIDEVAEFLSAHKSLVYRLMRNGQLPWTTIGARRRVRMSDVRKYVDSAA